MKRGGMGIPTIGLDLFGSSSTMHDKIPTNSYYAPQMQEVEEQKVTLHSTQFVQRFDTARPATIPSDGTEHKVLNPIPFIHTNGEAPATLRSCS